MWPFIMYAGLESGYINILIILLLILLLSRLYLLKKVRSAGVLSLARPVTAGAVLLCAGALIFRRQEWLWYYPLLVNAVVLTLAHGAEVA